jgi:hypothetical protein
LDNGLTYGQNRNRDGTSFAMLWLNRYVRFERLVISSSNIITALHTCCTLAGRLTLSAGCRA